MRREHVFTANDAARMLTRIEGQRHEAFEQILAQCYDRIKFMVSLGKQTCRFDVPRYIIGKPPYTADDIMRYLNQSLQKSHFAVKVVGSTAQFVTIEVEWPSRCMPYHSAYSVVGIRPADACKRVTIRSPTETKASRKYVPPMDVELILS